MRIIEIRETSVSLADPMANAALAYDGMTASAVAVSVDTGSGRPVTGYGFSSIGRYAQGGLIRERFAPRLLAASDLAGPDGSLDPARALAVMTTNEKPGGDGDRGGAMGVLDMALWDAVSKSQGVPLWHLLAERFGGVAPARIPVYATGGHYHGDGDHNALLDEVRAFLDMGFHRIKIKCGRDGLDDDRARIEAVLTLLHGDGARLAVDVNCAYGSGAEAMAMVEAYAPYDLAWIEEPCHPLDFALLSEVAGATETPIGTGENLFARAEVANLFRYGGLRADRDLIQVDPALACGLIEYRAIMELAAGAGWTRTRLVPHAGHLLALHAVAGFGLGAHEVAPRSDLPIGGLPAGTDIVDGRASRPERPGLGFEAHPGLWAALTPVAAAC